MKILKIFCLYIFLTFLSCNPIGENKNIIVEEYPNPQKSLKVIMFEKDGNATVNNSIQVSVESYNYKLQNSDTGNIFISDDIELVKFPSDLILVRWLGNNKLQISYPSRSTILRKEKNVKSDIGEVKVICNSR